MKKSIKNIIITAMLIVSPMLISNLLAQGDPPIPGGSPVGGPGGPVGGPASIDGGSIIFLVLGAAYGLKKAHKLKKVDEIIVLTKS